MTSKAAKDVLKAFAALADARAVRQPTPKQLKQDSLLRVLENATRDRVRLRQLEGQVSQALTALVNPDLKPKGRMAAAYRALTIDPVIGEFIAQSKSKTA